MSTDRPRHLAGGTVGARTTEIATMLLCEGVCHDCGAEITSSLEAEAHADDNGLACQVYGDAEDIFCESPDQQDRADS